MSEIFLAIKTLGAAALIVCLLQVKVGSATLEAHSEKFITDSRVAHFIQGAAMGGILATQDLYQSIREAIDGLGDKNPSSVKARK